MKNFIFRFGLCGPSQWRQNELHGWDDEDSDAFVVSAPSAEDALAWGAEVAEGYTRRLFEQSGWAAPPSWKEAQFAHWIDKEPERWFKPEDLARLPKVAFKEMPDFDGWPYVMSSSKR